MQMLLGTLLLAVLLPASGQNPDPTCRAQLKGPRLMTSIQFQSGLALQAPWRVIATRRTWQSETQSTMVVDLALESIEEKDDLTGERRSTRLARPIQVTVEGATEAEVVFNAAQTWCSTVIRVRGEQAASTSATMMKPGHIT